MIFSRSILCYLVNKYGRETEKNSQLYPVDPEQRAMVDRLLFFDNGTLYKNIVDYFVMPRIECDQEWRLISFLFSEKSKGTPVRSPLGGSTQN